MRIWFSTAPLASRLKGAGGAVENRNRQGLHLRTPKTCPNKPDHLCWDHRYELFSKFDEGIQYDKEGFETSKSEPVAEYVARHLPGRTVFDAFTGLGGSAIAFARQGKRVISVELSGARSAMARHNAKIYGVEDKIEFVVGNSLKIWKEFEFDSAYFDPPWGGVGYERPDRLFFHSLQPDISELLVRLVRAGRNVAVTLPLNFDLNEIKTIGSEVRLKVDTQHGKPYCMHCFWVLGAQ